MARRARSKQAMQKDIKQTITHWGASDTFKTQLMTSNAGGFEEECIVKRLRVSLAIKPDVDADLSEGVYWAILQTATDSAPVEADLTENNLVVAGGLVTAQNAVTYDHTITMRKLRGSAVWLCIQAPNTFSGTPVVSTWTQMHYVEG